ncbi:hypothetical protein TGAM01_v205907 [Trichoderma gamsii]|uniref:Uncharacterized protein n=1 Tax=Trichoderma gamsii TaxID=398673 RepID=A0A2P4ZLQ5_9HYPO|nr:hypothetical protein TGAM01_v205907 [Trichoderma gamsii]PON25221.1 hypothetical protein TGAM01_v205907 [Trichoderma gamsii]
MESIDELHKTMSVCSGLPYIPGRCCQGMKIMLCSELVLKVFCHSYSCIKSGILSS